MPDISYQASISVTKDFLDTRISVTNVTANMSEVGMQSLTYSLTTNTTSLSTAGLTTVGLAFLRNLSTATVSTAQIGVLSGSNFVSFATLRAGEPAVLRLSGGAQYRAIGTTGTRLRVDVTEG